MTNEAVRTDGDTVAIDRRWAALVVIALAQLMVALDATIVNIALPSAQRALSFTSSDRQWVITAYTVAFAGLLLLGGRTADHLGHRRAFLIGLIGFGVSSALAGAAHSFAVLVAGRALQGAFAALLTPTALSMVAVTFTETKQRAKAFGVYGAVASSGAAVGLLAGGVITAYLGWRWCLYVNVAIAAVGLVAGRAVLPRPPASAPTRIDVAAGVLITLGLAAIVFGCGQAAAHGWAAPVVDGPILGGMVAIVLFGVRERRAESPLLPLGIVADRSRVGAYVAAAATVVGSFGTFLMLTYYLQGILHYSPLRAGLAFLPLTGAVSASAYGLASRLLPRVPARVLMVPGLLVAGSGLVLLSGLSPRSGYVSLVLPAELLLGAGMGCIFTPALSVATSGVARRQAGVAAAAANTAMQTGGSIGIAVLNTIAIAATRSYVSTHHATTISSPPALVHGYAIVTACAAGLVGAAAVAAFALIRPPRPGRLTGGDNGPRPAETDRRGSARVGG